MSLLFNLLYLLAISLMLPAILWRSWRTGRYRRGVWDKLAGLQSAPNTNGKPVVWFHGVSVGEVNLLKIVVTAFQQQHPDWCVIVSSTTDTGLAEACKHFGDGQVIVYPFDFSWAIERTIQLLQPRLIGLAESELWPNFLAVAKRHRIPVVVLNGRMSPRTFRRYTKVAGLVRGLLFGQVTRFLMQSERYAQHLRDLGVDSARLCITGSVKYDSSLPDRTHPKVAELRRLFSIQSDELIWVAGSTHAPEEQIACDVFARLRPRFPQLRLIIVPRSPERFNDVATLIAQSGQPCARRSEMLSPVNDPTAIILSDTMGELGAIWTLASVGFTGGSLNDQRGGQSMIEPAGLGIPVLFGPHTWNFKDAVAGLLEVNGAIQIANATELEQRLAELLESSELRQKIGTAAREFVLKQQGATARTMAELDDLLED